MNPFTEPTVAKAIPENKRTMYWSSGRTKKTVLKYMCNAVVAFGVLMPAMSYCVELNQASLEELKSVRGIGSKTAQLIIEERNRGGQFDSLEDLAERVKGIGPKKAASLQAAGLTIKFNKNEADSPVQSHASKSKNLTK